jgi:hypothetical protein
MVPGAVDALVPPLRVPEVPAKEADEKYLG